MVEHARESTPSAHVERAVRAIGGREALERELEAKLSEARAFSNVTRPAEAYDLLLDGEVVGQVVRDTTRLKGMPDERDHWVLVQGDADYSLVGESAGEAIRHARSIVAARLVSTGENPSGPGPLRRSRRSGAKTVGLTAIALLVGTVVALALSRRR